MKASNLKKLTNRELHTIQGGGIIETIYKTVKQIIRFIDSANGRPQL